MYSKKLGLKKITTIILTIFFIGSLGYFLYTKDSMGISVSVFCLILAVVLYQVNKRLPKLLSDGLYSVFMWYACIASVLGSGYGFYDIPHYDDFLHVTSGLLTVTAAYTFIKFFNTDEQISKMNIIFIAMFIFMFSMGIASLWEIGEFSMDHIMHTHTQIGGLTDTVMDMIDALVGCLVSIPYALKKIRNKKN